MSPLIRLISFSILLYCSPLLLAEESTTPPPPAPAAQAQPEEKGLAFSLSGEFDKYFFPTKLDFTLPVFKLNIKDVVIDLNDLGFTFKKDKTNKGLELANIRAWAKKMFVHVPEENALVNLENFEEVTENQQEGDVINSVVRSHFDRLTLPKRMTKTAEDLNLRYNSTLEFNRLDAESLLALQKHFYELRASGMFDQIFQTNGKEAEDAAATAGGMFAMAMMGKMIEIAPKLMARSPEMLLSQFNLSSEKSEINITGQANVGIVAPPGEPQPKFDGNPNVVGASKVEMRIEKNLFKTLIEEMFQPEDYQAKIKSLVDEKLMNDTGSHYEVTLTADYKDHKLTMNKAMETFAALIKTATPPKTAETPEIQDAATEAVSLLKNLSVEVAQQYETTGKWTVTQKLTGEKSGKYTAKIDSNTKQLYLQATLKGIDADVPANLARKTIRLSYDRKEKTWKCESGKPNGIDVKDFPANCQ